MDVKVQCPSTFVGAPDDGSGIIECSSEANEMEGSMTKFTKFLRDESGAVTIDWVALTAGVLLLAIVVVYAIFDQGVTSLSSTMISDLQSAGDSIAATDGLPPLTVEDFAGE